MSKATKTYLKSSSSKVDTSTSYCLWLKSNKHIGSKAVIHVIPENYKSKFVSHFKAYYEIKYIKVGDSIYFIIFSSLFQSFKTPMCPKDAH